VGFHQRVAILFVRKMVFIHIPAGIPFLSHIVSYSYLLSSWGEISICVVALFNFDFSRLIFNQCFSTRLDGSFCNCHSSSRGVRCYPSSAIDLYVVVVCTFSGFGSVRSPISTMSGPIVNFPFL